MMMISFGIAARYDILHDALTGLANRRAFDERIETELVRNRRYGHSFSLAMISFGIAARSTIRGARNAAISSDVAFEPGTS